MTRRVKKKYKTYKNVKNKQRKANLIILLGPYKTHVTEGDMPQTKIVEFKLINR